MNSSKFEIGTVYAQSHRRVGSNANWKCIGRKETVVDGCKNPIVTVRMVLLDASGCMTNTQQSFRAIQKCVAWGVSCESISMGSRRYAHWICDSHNVVAMAAAA